MGKFLLSQGSCDPVIPPLPTGGLLVRENEPVHMSQGYGTHPIIRSEVVEVQHTPAAIVSGLYPHQRLHGGKDCH